MQEPLFQFSTITLLLVLSLAGMIYVIRMDIQLARYAARVKRKDTLFWRSSLRLPTEPDIIDALQERRDDDSYSFRESSIKPPHQQWRNERDRRQGGEGYND
jgi:hypothetical protein